MHKRGELAVYGSIVLAGIAYLALRKWFLGYVYIMDTTANTGSGVLLIQKVLLTAEALGRYLFLAIYPYAGLSVTHPHKIPVALNDTLAWISLAAIIGSMAVLHILPMTIGDNIILERFLTYRLTVFALAITALAVTLARPGTGFSGSSTRVATAGVTILPAFVLTLNIINIRVTVPLWYDNRTPWTWAVTSTPDSGMAPGESRQFVLLRRNLLRP